MSDLTTVFVLRIASADELGDFNRDELLDLYLSSGAVFGTVERAMAAAEQEWQEVMDPGFEPGEVDDEGEPLVWEGEEPLVFVEESYERGDGTRLREWIARPDGDDGETFKITEQPIL